VGKRALGVTNLEQRNGVWFARLTVPAGLRAKVGCTVMRRSLQTTDMHVALGLKDAVLVEFRERLLAAEREPAVALVPTESAPVTSPFNYQMERRLEVAQIRANWQRREAARLEQRWRQRTGQETAPTPLVKVEVITFVDAARACIEGRKAGWTRDAWTAPLERHAFPKIGAVPVSQIDTNHVHNVLAPIWAKTPQIAKKLRSYVEGILAYARVRKWRDGPNPAAWSDNLKHLLAPTNKIAVTKHHEAMDWRDIPAFMAMLRRRDDIRSRTLEFAILTAARANEAIGATWAEIDLEARVWRIPAARMKQRREHVVPLTPRVAAILGDMKGRHQTFVFPGLRGRQGDDALRALVRQLEIGVTAHGFRASFRTWGADCGKDAELLEWSLAHTTGGAVEAAYRRSDALARRRVLMQAWCDYCSSCRS